MHENGPLNGFRVNPRSINDIRRIASFIRKVFFPHGEHVVDTETLLEKLPDYGMRVEILEDNELPRGVEACCIPETLTIYLKESTYSFVRNGNPRARFTVIHEIGHMILGHTRTLNREQPGQLKDYENSEWQANQYAAELLMPLDIIKERQLLSAPVLSKFFGVSPQAAETRIRKLKRRNEI